MKFAFYAPVAIAAVMIGALCPAHATDTADIMRRIRDPRGGIVVVAHRGCHEAAPRHRLPTAPENSRAALEHCVALGVDVMETDVRKTRDGYLVMIHDDRVDRTTDGKGEVAQMTLAELKALHLRENEGGPTTPSTTETILTLDEILALAKGRIVLNLDIKDMIYPEVIAAAERAGVQDRVVVKTTAGVGTAVLASMTPYDRVPFAVIPTTGDAQAADLPSVLRRQMSGEVKPVAFELPYIAYASLAPIARQATASRVRLWVNTLWTGFVVGAGGDRDALRDPEAVWGTLAGNGVTMFQTDEPEALLRYREARAIKSAKSSNP